MHALTLLWLPAASLAILLLTGLGPAAVLGKRLQPDACVALAVLLGATSFALGSMLLLIDVPVEAIVAAVVAVFAALAVLVRRDAVVVARAAAFPLAAAGAAVVLVSVPWLSQGSWAPATHGNVDPYLWVSQAKSYLDGPAPLPAETHPDRIAYERIAEQQWPLALPFGVAAVAWLSGDDPGESYSAFAVLLAALLALAGYLTARGALEWSPRKSAMAAVCVPASSYLLFSTFYGWQAQIGLTAFATASVVCFRLALDEVARVREQMIAGALAAAAVATYGTLFLSFVPLYVCVLGAFALRHRHHLALGSVARVVGGTSAAALVIGLVPSVWAARSLDSLSDAIDVPAWERYAHGLPSEALGLMLRSTNLGRPSLLWSAGSTAVAIAILIVLVLLLRNGRSDSLGRRYDLLLGGSALFVVAMLFFRLPGFSPYYSMKLGGYGAPLLVLTAFAVLSAPRPQQQPLGRLVLYTRIAAAYLFFVATTNSLASGVTHMRRAERYAPIAAAVPMLPSGGAIEIDVRDPWVQTWAVYYLRERPLVVRRPSLYLTGLGLRPRSLDTTTTPRYRVFEDDGRSGIWHADGYVLRALAGR